MRVCPIAVLSHLTRRIRLERVEDYASFPTASRHYDMHMVSADIERVQVPTADCAGVTNGLLYAGPLMRIESDRIECERALVMALPSFARLDVKRLVDVTDPIGRAALISVQPGAVATERDQTCERCVSVVPHRRYPVATAAGTDLITRRSQRLGRSTHQLPQVVLTS